MCPSELGRGSRCYYECHARVRIVDATCHRALKIVGGTVFLEYALVAHQKDLIVHAKLGFKPGENMMRNTLAIALATVLVIGLTALADAKSQKACDIGCSKYTGGQRNSTIYTKCMEKCAQR